MIKNNLYEFVIVGTLEVRDESYNEALKKVSHFSISGDFKGTFNVITGHLKDLDYSEDPVEEYDDEESDD